VVKMVKVIMDPGIFEGIITFTLNFEKGGTAERGGLLIGKKIKEIYEKEYSWKTLAAVFPPQDKSSPTYCKFDGRVLWRVREAINRAVDYLSTSAAISLNRQDFIIFSWIHTHPNMGIFLSNIDRNTIRKLSKFFPDIVAVVIDPINRTFGAFNKEYEKLPLDIRVTEFDRNEIQLLDMFRSQLKIINAEKGIYPLDEIIIAKFPFMEVPKKPVPFPKKELVPVSREKYHIKEIEIAMKSAIKEEIEKLKPDIEALVTNKVDLLGREILKEIKVPAEPKTIDEMIRLWMFSTQKLILSMKAFQDEKYKTFLEKLSQYQEKTISEIKTTLAREMETINDNLMRQHDKLLQTQERINFTINDLRNILSSETVKKIVDELSIVENVANLTEEIKNDLETIKHSVGELSDKMTQLKERIRDIWKGSLYSDELPKNIDVNELFRSYPRHLIIKKYIINDEKLIIEPLKDVKTYIIPWKDVAEIAITEIKGNITLLEIKKKLSLRKLKCVIYTSDLDTFLEALKRNVTVKMKYKLP